MTANLLARASTDAAPKAPNHAAEAPAHAAEAPNCAAQALNGAAPKSPASDNSARPPEPECRCDRCARPRDPVPPGSRHGALTTPAAEQVLGAAELRAELAAGTWAEPWPGVVLPASLAAEPLARAEAALLRAGPHAVLSGPTAVAMHGCTAAEAETVHVTVPYDRQPRPAPELVVRQAWVREPDVLELDGLRVHALEVALAELLCSGPPRTALACLEQAMDVLGGAALRFRAAVAEQVHRRNDRRGTRRAADLLDLAGNRPSAAAPVAARIEAAVSGGRR